MPRYKNADLLRSYERLNITSGANWLNGAAKRYGAPKLAPMGLDSAAQLEHGVNTLAYVGDDGDGLGGLMSGDGLLVKIPLTSQQKLLVIATLAFHGYKRGVTRHAADGSVHEPRSWEGAALWAFLGMLDPVIAGGLALYSGFTTPKPRSKFKTF